jgi:hypothetical protein
MSEQKEKLQRLMIDTGCDPEAWFSAASHVADVHNCTANESINWQTPAVVRDGDTPDISSLIQHQFWDLVYYAKYEVDFPSKGANEGLGRWLGRALSYGDKMCYRILDVETCAIVIRSMVRSVEDRPNKGLAEIQRIEEMNPYPSEKIPFPVLPFAREKTFTNQREENPPIQPEIYQKGPPAVIDPNDLIDIYVYDVYKNRKGGETSMRGKVTERICNNKYRVSFENGKQRVYEYEEIINMANKPDDDDEQRWVYEAILSHRWSSDKDR